MLAAKTIKNDANSIFHKTARRGNYNIGLTFFFFARYGNIVFYNYIEGKIFNIPSFKHDRYQNIIYKYALDHGKNDYTLN